VNRKAFASKLYYGSGCFVLFFVAAAASFNGYYGKWRLREIGANGPSDFSFETMMDGTAARPFVYRQLLPMLANWVDQRVPEQTKNRLFAANSRVGIAPWKPFPLWSNGQSRAYFLRYLVVYFAVFLFAWISVYAMFLVCKSVGYAPPTAALSAIVVILLMPYFMTIGGYFYDYPELAFLALAVWMALNFEWWWMIPIVALATCNKESFLLFIPALYPLLRRRRSRIHALVGAGTLGLTCAAVYCVLRLHFQHNPGATVELHFIDQIQSMFHPSMWFQPEWTYSMELIRSFNPLSIALAVWTLWRGWRTLPKAIQRHAQIAAAINLPLYFLFCVPGELRDLSFLYVTFLLLIAANLTGWSSGQDMTATGITA
jgi:hypothetical protein